MIDEGILFLGSDEKGFLLEFDTSRKTEPETNGSFRVQGGRKDLVSTKRMKRNNVW